MVSQQKPCAFCGKPSTLLCDYIFGFSIAGWSPTTGESAFKAGRLNEFVRGKGLPYIALDESEMFTCDAPLCAACATNGGHMSIGLEGVDSLDLCPAHAGGEWFRRITTTAEAAERERKLAWKHRIVH